MSQKVDIHNIQYKYELAMKLLKQDKNISEHNKQIFIKYLNEAEIGKTVLHREKKKIQRQTILKYIYGLKIFSHHIKSNYEEVTQEEMDSFIRSLELDKIRKISSEPYSERSKVDIKLIIKKFYKWLLGDNQEYPKLVRYIDTFQKSTEVPAITKEEVEKMLDHASTVRNRALIHFLFDSGARIEEALNVRYKHITYDEEQTTFKVRIEFSKTKPRTVYLPLCGENMRIFLETKQWDDEELLFPLQYNYIRKMLRVVGKKYLKKNVTPHMLRHSSATFYAPKLNPYQMNKRYGWIMSSRMPDRYIDREGIHDKASVDAVRVAVESEYKKERDNLRNEMSILKQQMTAMIQHMGEEVLKKAMEELKSN
jgi:integrase